LERTLAEDQDCADILRLITSARGAMNGIIVELLEDQLRFHVLDPKQKLSSAQASAAEGLIETIRSYVTRRRMEELDKTCPFQDAQSRKCQGMT
jgi:DNA-binding FrmR family transcriptional regulator